MQQTARFFEARYHRGISKFCQLAYFHCGRPVTPNPYSWAGSLRKSHEFSGLAHTEHGDECPTHGVAAGSRSVRLAGTADRLGPLAFGFGEGQGQFGSVVDAASETAAVVGCAEDGSQVDVDVG